MAEGSPGLRSGDWDPGLKLLVDCLFDLGRGPPLPWASVYPSV